MISWSGVEQDVHTGVKDGQVTPRLTPGVKSGCTDRGGTVETQGEAPWRGSGGTVEGP